MTTTEPESLEMLVATLAEARRVAEQTALLVEQSHQAWLQDTVHLRSMADYAKKGLNNVEAALRSYAVARFQETGEKRIGWGVQVKLMQRLVYSEKEALEWADKHGLALQLDKRAFESIAKAQHLGFVTYATEPVATLPTGSDLSTWKDRG